MHVPAKWTRPLVQLSWLARLQPIDQGWFDMAFSVPLLDTTRAREVIDWAPRWTSLQALSDLGQGFLHADGTASPVLRRRSFATAVRRDITKGPPTTRRVP